jgi:hypothetical protein
MYSFTLPTGKTVKKEATYCVATKTRGRWHHRFFKSHKGADNEYKMQRAHLRSPDVVAAYGLEESKLIKGEPM